MRVYLSSFILMVSCFCTSCCQSCTAPIVTARQEEPSFAEIQRAKRMGKKAPSPKIILEATYYHPKNNQN